MFQEIETWDPQPLRRVLERSGFTQRGLLGLGLEGVPFIGRASGCLRASLPPGTAINVLARLFMLDDEVSASEVLPVFGSELAPLTSLGLLQVRGGCVRSQLQLLPLSDGWFASDFLRLHTESPDDFVMSLSPVTKMLASLTPRRQGTRLLELGCGAAWLSLDFRRAGLEVTATDFNNRALDIARFNARLNSITGIEWLQGSWFDPITSREFDVIACNPPYVQSPGSKLCYREAAPGAENPCAHILRHVAEYLATGGTACVVINWSHTTQESWRDSPLAWTPAAGVRRWLFQSKCHSPAEYAWRWIEHDPLFEKSAAAQAELDRWVRHFRENGIHAISSGFMIVQRCESGEEWTRTDSRETGELAPDCGEEILRLCANESWLQTVPTDEMLLDASFKIPDGIRAEIFTRLGYVGWQDRTIRLMSPGRLTYDGQVDENLMRLLEILRKSGTPRKMVEELRTRPEYADDAGLDSQICGLVRELARFSLIAPTKQTNSPLPI